MTTRATPEAGRRERADGRRSRAAILEGAASLATVAGLDGLSIGRLADEIGMSKSGLYAHFGSKQDLQLATIDDAERTFDREVVDPALDHPPGLARVRGLAEAFLSHLERRVFPGGCFFASAAAELAPREGPVRERIREFAVRWAELAEGFFAEAIELGEIDPRLDPAQLAFELDGMLLAANSGWVLFADPAALTRGREAVERALEAARP